MSASQYTPGFGSAIAYAVITSGIPGSYIKIAQSKDISSPDQEVGDIKVTNNDSPNNSHEYGPGLLEPGDLEWEVVYVKATFEAIAALVNNGIIYAFKETFPDGALVTFNGYFKDVHVEGKTEDTALIGKMKIKVCTQVVWA